MTASITADQEQTLIGSGIMFLRDLTSIYGSEAGLTLWDSMVANLDPDIKGKIFFAMLVGEHSAAGVFYIHGIQPGNWDFVQQIKSMRQVTGLGLKEAKDICDDLRMGRKQHKVECQSSVRWQDATHMLRNAGFLLR